MYRLTVLSLLFFASSWIWAKPKPELQITWPAAGLVRFELCRGTDCTPLGSKDGIYAVAELRAELNAFAAKDPDRAFRYVDGFLTVLTYPALVSTGVMTVTGATGSHLLSDHIRMMLFLPPIVFVSAAMKFNDIVNGRAADRAMDRELMEEILAGTIPAWAPLLRVPWLKKRLENVDRCRRDLIDHPLVAQDFLAR